MGQGYGLRKNPFQEVGECEIVRMFNSTALPWFLTLLISVHTAVCSVIFFYSCIFGCPPPSPALMPKLSLVVVNSEV